MSGKSEAFWPYYLVGHTPVHCSRGSGATHRSTTPSALYKSVQDMSTLECTNEPAGLDPLLAGLLRGHIYLEVFTGKLSIVLGGHNNSLIEETLALAVVADAFRCLVRHAA